MNFNTNYYIKHLLLSSDEINLTLLNALNAEQIRIALKNERKILKKIIKINKRYKLKEMSNNKRQSKAIISPESVENNESKRSKNNITHYKMTYPNNGNDHEELVEDYYNESSDTTSDSNFDSVEGEEEEEKLTRFKSNTQKEILSDKFDCVTPKHVHTRTTDSELINPKKKQLINPNENMTKQIHLKLPSEYTHMNGIINLNYTHYLNLDTNNTVENNNPDRNSKMSSDGPKKVLLKGDRLINFTENLTVSNEIEKVMGTKIRIIKVESKIRVIDNLSMDDGEEHLDLIITVENSEAQKAIVNFAWQTNQMPLKKE